MIQTEQLIIGYKNHPVMSGITFSIQDGELVALIGRNGSGKSTLLRTLMNLQPALGGTHTFMGLTSAELALQVALVLSHFEAADHTTVYDVVAMGRYPYTSQFGKLSEKDKEIIERSLSDVGLEPTMYTRPVAELSDGERQRVLIAKAIAQQTPIILLDEPTAHLDLPNRIQTFTKLQELAHNQHKTIIISTHELDLAYRYCDQILLMTDKQIMKDTPKNLKDQGTIENVFGLKY